MERQFHFSRLKELTEKLLESDEDSPHVTESIDRLYIEGANLETRTLTDFQKAQTEVLAVNLWNWAVSRRIEMLITVEQKVKLFHVACKLILMFDDNSPYEEAIQRQILMTMKTGKGWVDVGQPALADGFLEVSQKLLEKLYAKLLEKCQDSEEEEAQRADVNTDLFKVLSYHAESLCLYDSDCLEHLFEKNPLISDCCIQADSPKSGFHRLKEACHLSANCGPLTLASHLNSCCAILLSSISSAHPHPEKQN